MKRIVALGALLSTLVASAPAQELVPGKPFLWRISGPKPSYVFGTIHLSGPRETTLAPVVEKAIDEADAVLCEVRMDTEAQMKMAAALVSSDKPLSEVLPKELYARAEAELQQIHPALTLAPFQNMHVWALGVTLPLLEEQLKNPAAKPMDVRIYERAQAAGKDVDGLETIDEQFKILEGSTLLDQIALLRSTLDELEKARREKRSVIEPLRTAYLSGDLPALDAILNDVMAGVDPAVAKRFLGSLIIERNHRMAERIAAKLKAGNAKSWFFAIGAGHLHGEEGVLRLLEKAGFKIERLER